MRKATKVIGLLALFLWLLAGQGVMAGELEVRVNHLNLSLTPEGTLHVTEQYLLVNPGEAFSAEGLLSFPLPVKAGDIHYGSGVDEAKARVEEGMLILDQEVPAGETTINFHYILQTMEGTPHFYWERGFSHHTPTFFVMAPAGELRVASEKLEDQGVAAMGENSLHIYAGSFQQGETLNMTILPDMAAPGVPDTGDAGGIVDRETAPAFHDPGHVRLWEQSPFSGIDAHLFMLLVIGVPLGVLIWYLWKGRQSKAIKTDSQREEEVFQRFLIREKYLKQKIMELEKQRAEGNIDTKEYQQQLELFKKKLLEVRVRLRHFTE